MPKRYPAEFRRRALELVRAGRSVKDVARLLEVSDQTIYSWRRQEQIDRGELADVHVGTGDDRLAHARGAVHGHRRVGRGALDRARVGRAPGAHREVAQDRAARNEARTCAEGQASQS